MKRMIAMLLCLVLLLAGCGKEDPYRVDTVVRIPVNPTEATEEPATEEPATEEPETEVPETDAPMEAPTEPETEPEETEAPTEPEKTGSGGNKGSSGKPSSGSSGSGGKNPSEPPQTEPPVTEAETEPEVTEPQRYDISGFSPGSLEYAMADAINAAREAEGIASLQFSGRLSAIASCRGYEISQVWSHTRPDGRSFTTVLGDYGYGAGTVTELLVYVSGGADGASLVEKWLGSESHRNSLLSTGYSTVGIGSCRAGGYTYICCLLVG